MATIAQILPSLHAGGVERGSIEIASALIKAGHRGIVISAGGEMVAELTEMGAEHITLPVAGKQPLSALKRGAILAEVLQQEQVDLLHYRSRVPAWLSLIARKKLRKQGYHLPLVATYHGMYPAQNALKRFYNSGMIRADHTIAVSHAIAARIAEQYPNFDQQNLTVIPRGCDLDIFRPETDESQADWRTEWGLDAAAPVLMLVGRLTNFKGVAFMAQALAQVADLPWQFVSVGDYADYPEEVARIHQAFNAAGIGERMHFLGVQRDMANVYPKADILLSGSQQPEAFGRTIIEAASCGIPALVPDQGGTAEVVLDDKTGWHYRFRDTNDAARVLRKALMTSVRTRQQMGQAARARVLAHYRLEAMQESTLAVYTKMLRDI